VGKAVCGCPPSKSKCAVALSKIINKTKQAQQQHENFTQTFSLACFSLAVGCWPMSLIDVSIKSIF